MPSKNFYNKAIKPLKNDLWANDYTHIEDDFYLAFDGVKYDVINIKTGKFVFSSLYKHQQIKIHKFGENYWLLSFLYGKTTLINKPKYDDENIELSFPIMINGKPLFFYDFKPFNDSDVVILKDINDKSTIISGCGNILLKNIEVSNTNQIIISKNNIFIYDNNSNLIKINYN